MNHYTNDELKPFSIAAAQASSIKGDVEANVRAHAELVRAAVEHDVDVIVFPELSLTGYEPKIAGDTTIDIDDRRLAPLKRQSQQFGITIVAGAPIDCPGGKPYIGALILSTGNPCIYIKNYLHPGEEEYFSPGSRKSCIVSIKGEAVGLAICADVNHASHAEDAAKSGASIYAAGVLMMEGYHTAAQRLQQYAVEHSMVVLMANYGSPTGGYIPAGKSAIWDETGRLLATANETGTAIVVGTKEQNGWVGTTITT